MSEIKWIGSEDDLTSVFGKWILRVEQMDEDFWRFRASYNLEAITEGAASTKEEAISLMEESVRLNIEYNEHIN